MNSLILHSKSSFDRKHERLFSSRRVKMLNQHSIWFSHEQCFGVYTTHNLWLGSIRYSSRLFMVFNIQLLSLTPNSFYGVPSICATRRTSVFDLWVVWLSMTMQCLSPGALHTTSLIWRAKSSFVWVACIKGKTISPIATFRLAIRPIVP